MVVRLPLGHRMATFYLCFLEAVPLAMMVLRGVPVVGCDHMTSEVFVFSPNSHHCSFSNLQK